MLNSLPLLAPLSADFLQAGGLQAGGLQAADLRAGGLRASDSQAVWVWNFRFQEHSGDPDFD